MVISRRRMQPCRTAERCFSVMTQAPTDRAASRTMILVEAWLQNDLQRLYDRTLDEPVPEELLQLLVHAREPVSAAS